MAQAVSYGTFCSNIPEILLEIPMILNKTAGATASSKIKQIHDRVKKVKLSEKMGVKYMQLWEEKAYIRGEGVIEGRIEGRSEGIAAFILDYLEDGKSKDIIINKLIRRFSLSAEEAQQYYEKFSTPSH